MDPKQFGRRTEPKGGRDAQGERRFLSAEFRDERLHVRFEVPRQPGRQLQDRRHAEYESDEQDVVQGDETNRDPLRRRGSEGRELNHEA